MRRSIAGAVWRFSVFAVICVTAAFALIAVFAQLRFDDNPTYRAQFSSVTGLKEGNFVRIAGVEVGKVTAIKINDDGTATTQFSLDKTVVLTRGSRAVIRYANLTGDRYMALEEGAGGLQALRPGDTIAIDNTSPALKLDALIGGFKPLFRALSPDQVNALSNQLIAALQGEGANISSLLDQLSVLTNTLADRDLLIGEVITNLHTVLGSLSEQNGQFDKTVDSVSQLVASLAARKTDVTHAVENVNAASATVADLLVQARPSLVRTVEQTDRTAAIIVADHDYFDDFIATLPDAYRVLARQGIYGDFFNFYTCQIVLKLNGKGGQPVYVRVANQATGRCTPR